MSAVPEREARTAGGEARRNGRVRDFLLACRLQEWVLILYPVFLLLVSRRRGEEDLYAIDASAMAQIAFNALLGIYLVRRIAMVHGSMRRHMAARPTRWLFLYVLLAVASTLWSGRMDYTLYRSLEVLAYLGLIALVMRRLGTFENMVKLQLLFAGVLAVTWHLYMLAFTVDPVQLHNALGPGASVAVLFVGLTVRGAGWRAMYAAVLLSTLIGTSTATWLSAVGGAGVVVLFARGRKKYVGAALIVAVVALLAASPGLWDAFFYGKTEWAVRSGTGRVPVWEWVYKTYVVRKPLLGYGFGTGESLARMYNVTAGGLRMQHMHSIVFGALTNLGFIGLALMGAFLLDSARSAMALRRRGRDLIVGGMAAIAANSLSISSFASPMSFGFVGHTMFFTMVAVLISKQEETAGEERLAPGRKEERPDGLRR